MTKGHKLLRVTNILTIVTVVTGSWVYSYAKIYQTGLFKYVQFVVMSMVAQ